MNSDQSLKTLKPLQVRHFAGQVGTICSCSNKIDQDKSLVVIKAGRFLNFIYTIAPWKQINTPRTEILPTCIVNSAQTRVLFFFGRCFERIIPTFVVEISK